MWVAGRVPVGLDAVGGEQVEVVFPAVVRVCGDVAVSAVEGLARDL